MNWLAPACPVTVSLIVTNPSVFGAFTFLSVASLVIVLVSGPVIYLIARQIRLRRDPEGVGDPAGRRREWEVLRAAYDGGFLGAACPELDFTGGEGRSPADQASRWDRYYSAKTQVLCGW